jgi:Ni,Fe-hydrogenase III large subunit
VITGARKGTFSGLRRLAAVAMARDLGVFVIPGPEIARAHGLDIEAAGLHVVVSPRHASVLLIVGALPPALREAAAVIYAQMVRPRALFVLGTEELTPLPAADVVADLTQEDLVKEVRRLRAAFAKGAFRPDISDFDAPMLHVRIEYTCPMHPEVVQDEPGSCPKCGMNLVPREAQATAEQHHAAHNGGMDHSHKDHGDMAFMSMIDVTKDLPRSSDDLPMEWIDAPFGPFFPGLPGGLLLTLTLDGDTVAASSVQTLVGNAELLQQSAMDCRSFAQQLASMEPLAPVSYRLLACRAIENTAGVEVTADIARARIGALERERIASHLGWLALFGQQTGFDWLTRHTTSMQLKFLQADIKQVLALKPDVQSQLKRLLRTPLLKSRTADIGRLAPDTALHGPVARAAGIIDDARSADKTYSTLGFTPVSQEGGDALARLLVRIDEITNSLALIEAAGAIDIPVPADIGEASGAGAASVETPRGIACLQLTLEKGRVIAAQLETPSTHHLNLISTLTEQQALSDALVAVGSLDLSPWEVRQ